MYRTSYADYSNKKARNMGLATFKSWEQMSAAEKRKCKEAEKKSMAQLQAEARQVYEEKRRGL